MHWGKSLCFNLYSPKQIRIKSKFFDPDQLYFILCYFLGIAQIKEDEISLNGNFVFFDFYELTKNWKATIDFLRRSCLNVVCDRKYFFES